jgi:ABC-type antimicrobial peptide transport system permease subunit
MRYISKDYIIQEILDTVSLMQLNNETVPAIDSTVIEEIADAFIFTWKEVGDYEADISSTLLEFLRNEFKYNYK